MLPLPVSLAVRKQFSGGRTRRTKDILLTRSRVTNLGVLLLASFAVLSLLLNFGYYITSLDEPQVEIPVVKSLLYTPPTNVLDTIQRDETLPALTHLIVVAGHAIWKGNDASEILDEEQWILEAYQRGGGRVNAFVQHIMTGTQLAAEDPRSLLVFSGGQTRPSSTTTEAESYMRIATLSDALPLSQPVTGLDMIVRATTEDFALDSFQNLLYAIARFHEYTGRYPEDITVVGYEMKRRRFTELHRAALRWPESRFHYLGVDVEGDEAVRAKDGEIMNGYLPYTLDLYGCHGILLSKRRARNPFHRFHSYYTSSPELAGLMNWCPGPSEARGQTRVYDGPLPWDGLANTESASGTS
ncbi:hypothetical protein CERSUDRAFT_136170 [Gelatoporia subvermispora B]|uniref:DUF218 domain-containing protein n=1 Tax=Ceriporiopsis subvermispora (strain B) TaxID=914234 RepID=M2RFE8_CERS8|nr:hypothetical protein CERSUDRAFT_136170 [Gelatoporia subvermispora B]